MSLPIHQLGAQAMATEFKISIAGGSESRAQVIAAEVLRDLEPLEAELSRFRDSSDIARINALRSGEKTMLGEAAYDCIALAIDVHAATGGAYDISVAPLLAVWQNPDNSPRTPTASELSDARAAVGIEKISLNPESPEIQVNADEVWLDLGGIGKGYALDQMALLLREREIDNALLDAGGSTLLAMGDGPDGKGWPVGFGQPELPGIALVNRALSGSAFSERGEHIIDPRTGRPVPAAKGGAWALAQSAALADALSTAFLVLGDDEIRPFCVKHPEIGAVVPQTSP